MAAGADGALAGAPKALMGVGGCSGRLVSAALLVAASVGVGPLEAGKSLEMMVGSLVLPPTPPCVLASCSWRQCL